VLQALLVIAADDSTIRSVVESINAESSKLSKAAHGARGAPPSLDDIENKAMNLSTTIAKLATAIQRIPDEASLHVDELKKLGQDEFTLGVAMVSLSNADAGTDEDSIANIAAIADDI